MADEESASRERISPNSVAQMKIKEFLAEIETRLKKKAAELPNNTSGHVISPHNNEDGNYDLLENCNMEVFINELISNNNLFKQMKTGLNSNKEHPSPVNSKEASSTSSEQFNSNVSRVEVSCQTDDNILHHHHHHHLAAGDDDDVSDANGCEDTMEFTRLSEEFQRYRKNVDSIIQTSVKNKELQLEERFEARWRQLVAMETSIHEKLTQSEHHANCLHAALKSAMVELGNLKGKIDEFSVKNSSAQHCIPVDLRFIQTTTDVNHLNGTSEESTNVALRSDPSDGRLEQNPSSGRSPSSESIQMRCSSADDVTKSVDSHVTKPQKTLDNLLPKIPLLSGAHQFLLNFKYPIPTDSMLASYFPSALFCIPRSSVSSTSSPSSSTLSPSQYILPSINPFVKLPPGPLPASPPEPKPKISQAVQNISKLIGIDKSLSPCARAIHAASPLSVLSAHHPTDAFQPTKAEPLDGNSPDTSEIAQRVRDILSAHNIGQRQFAREVLGLSQGTVSELLSKPKPWDKLTEKGRESYRKMSAWTHEENNYLELKMSGYKNGSTLPQSSMNQPTSKIDESSSSTEMRISQILMQAQAAIHNQATLGRTPKIDLKVNGDSVKLRSVQRPLHNREPHPPPTNGRSSDLEGTSRRSDCQSTSNDSLNFVTRIYREQLLELMKTAEKNKNHAEVERYKAELLRISSQASSSSASTNNINMVDSTGILREEVKKEPLDRMDSECNNNRSLCSSDGPEDLSFGRNKNSTVKQVKEEPRSPESLNDDLNRRSENTSNDSGSNLDNNRNKRSGDGRESPLRQMQSITNSIANSSASSSINSFPSQQLIAARVQLPPIDQDTWEKCSSLDTDDIVQRVKELLSEYCISQRLFGEHVLGLSQGSVSDLLARPKPWYMLTHKGREPFVRMKCFLEEPQSVQNLVANQYKVPADKLLRVASTPLSLTQSISLIEPQNLGRKRKPSTPMFEESSPALNCDLEHSTSKKNRISFTDDQKKLLRQTYRKDPYPLHSTIEQLAATLEVGVKTVINWFHNHRMRDKSRFTPGSWDQQNQQNDLSISPLDNSNFSQFQVKTDDQSSQSCDSSSDFFLYLNNNDGQDTGTDIGVYSSCNENHIEDAIKQNHSTETEDTSEPDDADDDRPKMEPKIISKRKSARPQKMTCSQYVLDQPPLHDSSLENPTSSSSVDEKPSEEPPSENSSASLNFESSSCIENCFTEEKLTL